ncbi:MAG TPA: hypothetical protein VGH42_05745 [Verrucomicrobiae bacterium]
MWTDIRKLKCKAGARNCSGLFIAPKLFENVIASRVGSDSLTAPFFAPFAAIKINGKNNLR